MSFSYTVRESVSGFRRTRLSSTLSIVTICIALLLMGLFAVITIHAERFLEDLRNRVELEAFLVEPAATVTIDSVGQVITAFEGVDSVVHVSKANAAEIFKREFGEDILTVLDFNPLPPSMKIFLKDGYKTSRQVQLIEARLRTMPEIESVIYHKAMLEVIDERAGNIHHVTLALGVFISLSAIVLVSNTIRLAIYASPFCSKASCRGSSAEGSRSDCCTASWGICSVWSRLSWPRLCIWSRRSMLQCLRRAHCSD